MKTVLPDFRSGPQQQRGVVLLIALIMLVAMTLVGIAMLRSVGTGAGIAGNLAFKQNATSVGDLGVEVARAWMINTGANNASALEADATATGYYSTMVDGFNPLTYDWSVSKKVQNADATFIVAATGKDNTGNEVRYVLHRLCTLPGAVSPIDNPGQKCANYTDVAASSSKGGAVYGGALPTLSDQPYYRATVRVAGPRNTTSYVQVIMY
jgi:type IV pilus assembly protein PilX